MTMMRGTQGRQVVTVPDVANLETEVTYGAFNDEKFWAPLFDSGELDPVLRDQQLEKPLMEGTLKEVKRWVDFTNEQRVRDGKDATYGLLIIRKQTVTRTPWVRVTDDDFGALPQAAQPKLIEF